MSAEALWKWAGYLKVAWELMPRDLLNGRIG